MVLKVDIVARRSELRYLINSIVYRRRTRQTPAPLAEPDVEPMAADGGFSTGQPE